MPRLKALERECGHDKPIPSATLLNTYTVQRAKKQTKINRKYHLLQLFYQIWL